MPVVETSHFGEPIRVDVPQGTTPEQIDEIFQAEAQRRGLTAQPIGDNVDRGGFAPQQPSSQTITNDFGAPEAPKPRNTKPINLFQRSRQEFIERNQEGDIPLRLDEEVSDPIVRFNAAVRRSDEDKIAFLKDTFGDDSVRELDNGTVVIRRLSEETGFLEDVPLDKGSFTFGDVADLASLGPEVLGAAVGLRAGRGFKPSNKILKYARDLLSGVTGEQTAGLGTDVIGRVTAGQEVALPELAGERARLGLLSLITDSTLSGAIASTTKFKNSLTFGGRPDDVTREGLEAIDRINRRAGVDIQTTAGERTNSPFLQRAESFLGNIPGSSGFFKQLKDNRRLQLREAYKLISGPDELSPTVVGGKALQQLRRATIEPVDREAIDAADDLFNKAISEIKQDLQDVNPNHVHFLDNASGEVLQKRIRFEKDRFDNTSRALYRKVREVAKDEGESLRIDPTNFKKAVQSAVRPAKVGQSVKQVSKTTRKGIPGVSDDVVETSDVKERVLLSQLLPKSISSLRGVSGKIADDLSLQELRELRTRINQMVQQDAVVEGFDNARLRQVASAITSDIEALTSKAKGPVREALERANNYYRTNVDKFLEPGIKESLREVKDGGVGPNTVLAKLGVGTSGDVDLFKRYMEFFGPDTEAGEMVKQRYVNLLWQKATVDGTMDQIDGKRLVESLKGLDPQIRTELFGDNVSKLIQSSQLAAKAKGTLDLEEVKAFLKEDRPSFTAYERLRKAEAAREKTYRRDVVKRFVKGEVDEDAIKSDKFIRYFATKAPVKEVADTMSLFDEELQGEIRQAVIQDLFNQARIDDTAGAVLKRFTEDTRPDLINSKALAKAFGSMDGQGRLKAILGEESYGYLQDLIKVHTLVEDAGSKGLTAGSLVRGNILDSLVTKPVEGLSTIAKYRLVGMLMTTPGIKTLLSREIKDVDPERVAAMAVMSGAFMNSLFLQSDEPPVMAQVAKELRDFVEASGLLDDEDNGSP